MWLPHPVQAEEQMKLWLHFPVGLDYIYSENVTFTLNFSSGGELEARSI
jgi:hypothetical protein